MSVAAEGLQVHLTPSAAERVSQLIEMEGKPALRFRIAITGGGCSGFSYNFSLDDAVGEDDLVFDQHGVQVIVDRLSLELVNGSEIDFVEDLMGASFKVSNPNAASSCGCGSSFSV